VARPPRSSLSSWAMVIEDLVVYLVLCLVLLVLTLVAQSLIKNEHHRFHKYYRGIRIAKYVLSW
jgi:hypothetical protein